MVKAYLRYEAAGTFGVVASSAAPEFSSDGKQLYSPALENVGVWNVKQGTLVRGAARTHVRRPHAKSLAAPCNSCERASVVRGRHAIAAAACAQADQGRSQRAELYLAQGASLYVSSAAHACLSLARRCPASCRLRRPPLPPVPWQRSLC